MGKTEKKAKKLARMTPAQLEAKAKKDEKQRIKNEKRAAKRALHPKPPKPPKNREKVRYTDSNVPPPPKLMDLIHSFLASYSYRKAAHGMRSDNQKRQGHNVKLWQKSSYNMPTLIEIYEKWCEQNPEDASGNRETRRLWVPVDPIAAKKLRDDEKAAKENEVEDKPILGVDNGNSSSSSEETSSESEDSDESEQESEVENIKMAAAPTTVKAVADDDSDDTDTSEDDSDDESEEDSEDEEEDEIEAKAETLTKMDVDEDDAESEEDSDEESSDDSDDEDSDEEESEEDSKVDSAATLAKAEPADASASSAAEDSEDESSSDDSSDSESSSTSDSSDEDEDGTVPAETVVDTSTRASSDSSVTLQGDAVAAKAASSTPSSSDDSSTASSSSDDEIPTSKAAEAAVAHTSNKRKRSKDETSAANVMEPTQNAKRVKKEVVPFSRIPADIKVDDRFSSNKYVPYDYANKAHQDLIVTKGKGFTKEKNKKKKGQGFRGGMIDIQGKRGIKFED